jgi:hypothetical protein
MYHSNMPKSTFIRIPTATIVTIASINRSEGLDWVTDYRESTLGSRRLPTLMVCNHCQPMLCSHYLLLRNP